MIREISSASGGAQVVVLSDKENEQATDEIAVLITGTKEMKIEAASLVTEKIATFRYMAKVIKAKIIRTKNTIQGIEVYQANVKNIVERDRARECTEGSLRKIRRGQVAEIQVKGVDQRRGKGDC